jgi:hypothetical protein
MFDAADTLFADGSSPTPSIVVRICVSCPSCASTALAGTLGSTTLVPPDQARLQPACGGELELTPAGNATGTSLELHTADPSDGTIEATLPDELLALRTVTPPAPGTMCPGTSFALGWSPAGDLQGGAGTVQFGSGGFCGAGGECFPNPPWATFQAATTIDTQIAFVVPATPASITTSRTGTITASPGTETGAVPCTAASCTYSFSHFAQCSAVWAKSC